MEWLGLKHPLSAHLPMAAAVLLPLPLLLAQRAGRGIKPWWMTCRYLAWAAFLGLLFTLPSGLAWAKHKGSAPSWVVPYGTPLHHHQLLGLLSFFLGFPALWALYRRRREHEGIGWRAFFLGILFAGTIVAAGISGHRMAAQPPPRALAPLPPPKVEDPETNLPVRALDYAALQPMQADPVRSQPHGGRFVRTWMNAAGAAAYQAGEPLPEGAFAVLSSQEPRWGRPGPEPGPLWAYGIGPGGKPIFQFYWAHVPQERRAESEGKDRIYWRKDAPQLNACIECHAGGASDPIQRAKVFRPRRPPIQAPPAP